VADRLTRRIDTELAFKPPLLLIRGHDFNFILMAALIALGCEFTSAREVSARVGQDWELTSLFLVHISDTWRLLQSFD
jgi:hypothetical protein